eukprot:4126207-Pyramimonas_sp.AAC.1
MGWRSERSDSIIAPESSCAPGPPPSSQHFVLPGLLRLPSVPSASIGVRSSVHSLAEAIRTQKSGAAVSAPWGASI